MNNRLAIMHWKLKNKYITNLSKIIHDNLEYIFKSSNVVRIKRYSKVFNFYVRQICGKCLRISCWNSKTNIGSTASQIFGVAWVTNVSSLLYKNISWANYSRYLTNEPCFYVFRFVNSWHFSSCTFIAYVIV